MKVYLNHITTTRFHSIYQELVKFGPVKYVNEEAYQEPFKNDHPLLFKIGKLVVNTVNIPSFNFVRQKNLDLIHSSQNIPISKTPFVVDFEHVSAFAGWNNKRIQSRIFKRLLQAILESPRCNKILPWTIAAKKSLTNLIPSENIKEKIEVVYPAMTFPTIKKRRRKDLTILFVAYNFYRKGGEEVVKAFSKLLRDFPKAKLNIVCELDNEMLKYKSNNITFDGITSRSRLFNNYYPNSDIFVHPSFHDTFGMVYLEAAAFGLPIICLNEFATPEIVKEGVNGYVINVPRNKWYNDKFLAKDNSETWHKIAQRRTSKEKAMIVEELHKKMKLLTKNSALRQKISINNRQLIKQGKFSIKHRNKQLKKIYDEAIS